MANPLSRRLRTTLFYALRTAFRLTPMPQVTRDKLRQRFLDTRGHWVPEGPKGKPPGDGLPRRPYVRSDERAIGYVPYQKGELPDPLPATLVAFYLPQFHTIPENDEWWGKGFTEWRNVTRALPQFEGHYQPKLPGDLGFYDLRNVEVMHEQARLAREYGISAFCFYFYWFGGKTLLETPLRNWLSDKTIDLQFCLCWANEKWTRTWDGRGDEVLIDQKHSPEDDVAFIEHVAEYMRDPRYLRVDGKPILVVYRPGLFPDMKATATRWRTWCRDHGVGEIHLAYVMAFDAVDPATIGFDAAIEFPPLRSTPGSCNAQLSLINPDYKGQVLDWRDMASHFMQAKQESWLVHPGVNPGWDNEARRSGQGRSFIRATPSAYQKWLEHAITRVGARPGPSRPVFINAWNEWAEGAVLEPDAAHGHSYLNATRRALVSGRTANSPSSGPCVVIHAWYLDVLDEILDILVSWDSRPVVYVTCSPEHVAEVQAILAKSKLPHEIVPMANRGRDILPFLRLASRLRNEGVDVVLKLHTKKSPHLQNGEQWRRELVGSLANDANARSFLAAFRDDPTLGLIAPPNHILPLADYMGGNRNAVERLAAAAGITGTTADDSTFVSGSMFWVRLEAVSALLESGLYSSDFEDECGQVDGTTAHAIERLFAAGVKANGYHVLNDSSEITGRRQHYPYAKS